MNEAEKNELSRTAACAAAFLVPATDSSEESVSVFDEWKKHDCNCKGKCTCGKRSPMGHFTKIEPIAEKVEGESDEAISALLEKAKKDGNKDKIDAYSHLLADSNDVKIAFVQYNAKTDKELKDLLASYKANVASSDEWVKWADKNGKPSNMSEGDFKAFTTRQKDYGEQMQKHVDAIEKVLGFRDKGIYTKDDAEFEQKHPRKGGKFVKKGDGVGVPAKVEEMRKETMKRNAKFLDSIEKLSEFTDKNGEEVKNGADYSSRIEFLKKNRQLFDIDGFASVKAEAGIGEFGNFILMPSKQGGDAASIVSVCECLGLGTKLTDNGNVQVYMKKATDYSKMSDVDLGKAHADAVNNKNAILARKIEKEQNARYAAKCGKMTDADLDKEISDKKALVERYGKKDNPYAKELEIAEAEKSKRGGKLTLNDIELKLGVGGVTAFAPEGVSVDQDVRKKMIAAILKKYPNNEMTFSKVSSDGKEGVKATFKVDKSKLKSVGKFDDKNAEAIMSELRAAGFSTKFGARATLNKYSEHYVKKYGKDAFKKVMNELADDGKTEYVSATDEDEISEVGTAATPLQPNFKHTSLDGFKSALKAVNLGEKYDEIMDGKTTIIEAVRNNNVKSEKCRRQSENAEKDNFKHLEDSRKYSAYANALYDYGWDGKISKYAVSYINGGSSVADSETISRIKDTIDSAKAEALKKLTTYELERVYGYFKKEGKHKGMELCDEELKRRSLPSRMYRVEDALRKKWRGEKSVTSVYTFHPVSDCALGIRIHFDTNGMTVSQYRTFMEVAEAEIKGAFPEEKDNINWSSKKATDPDGFGEVYIVLDVGKLAKEIREGGTLRTWRERCKD